MILKVIQCEVWGEKYGPNGCKNTPAHKIGNHWFCKDHYENLSTDKRYVEALENWKDEKVEA